MTLPVPQFPLLTPDPVDDLRESHHFRETQENSVKNWTAPVAL